MCPEHADALSTADESGLRERECVQNMLMHCQPKTKANCVKIETKLNSISATTTSRQETLTNRRGKNKEDPITHVTSSRRSPQASRKAKCRAKHLERRGCRQGQKDGTENRIQQKPRDTPVGPGRTPTVHWCPRGEAVGGPSTNTTRVVRRSTEPITRM